MLIPSLVPPSICLSLQIISSSIAGTKSIQSWIQSLIQQYMDILLITSPFQNCELRYFSDHQYHHNSWQIRICSEIESTTSLQNFNRVINVIHGIEKVTWTKFCEQYVFKVEKMNTASFMIFLQLFSCATYFVLISASTGKNFLVTREMPSSIRPSYRTNWWWCVGRHRCMRHRRCSTTACWLA